MALGDLEVKGNSKFVGTVDLAGGAKDATLVTSLNADQMDSADKDTDGTLAANSDVKIPSQKAAKTYIDGLDAANVKKTGAQSIAGVKTFSDGIISNVTGALTGNAATATLTDGIKETGAGTHTIKCKVIDIGDWNMDSTEFVDVNHGMGSDYIKIRQVQAMIRDDIDSGLLPLDLFYQGSYTTQGGVRLIDSTKIRLMRQPAPNGYFDSTSFDATSFNRGWITLWYEA